MPDVRRGRRYEIRYTPAASRQVKKLPPEHAGRIKAAIEALADNPDPPGVELVKGPERHLRIRVGDYRVVYGLHVDVLVVLIVRVEHRSTVYRRR